MRDVCDWLISPTRLSAPAIHCLLRPHHSGEHDANPSPERLLAEWFDRLRLVAQSSTATNIEPWDIGAFLLTLNTWAASFDKSEGAAAFLLTATKINPKNAVRP